MLLLSRRAKIVATLGPASSNYEMIQKLILAGMNVARINMSHSTHEAQGLLIDTVRKAASDVETEVAILLDLQGPKIRVDKLETNLILHENDEWVIGATSLMPLFPEYKDKFIPTVYTNLVSDAHDKATILFDDGLMEAVATEKIIDKRGELLKIKIITGGILKSNKGINLPDVKVSAPSLTQKDEEDLVFGLKKNVDFIALSFVREASDILHVKKILHKYKKDIPIISKIEKPEAITNFSEILDVTDLIMIARGDMGVEVGNHLVPGIQKKITKMSNERGVPVITATQMLESMIQNPRPTRAEATDVANAIWDGTDAVMLSGETAAGKYPVEAIKFMSQLIEEAEKTPRERIRVKDMEIKNTPAVLQVAASLMGEHLKAKWIVSVTERGNSCLNLSRFRPTTPVLGVTNNQDVARRLAMYWGITPYYVMAASRDISNLESHSIKKMRKDNLIKTGDRIIITHGDGQYFMQGTSNSLRFEVIKRLPEEAEEISVSTFSKGKILYDISLCASCQECIKVCPFDIWQADGDKVKVNANQIEKCILDMACVEKCPSNAIEIIPVE